MVEELQPLEQWKDVLWAASLVAGTILAEGPES